MDMSTERFESIIIAANNNAIRIHHIKARIDMNKKIPCVGHVKREMKQLTT